MFNNNNKNCVVPGGADALLYFLSVATSKEADWTPEENARKVLLSSPPPFVAPRPVAFPSAGSRNEMGHQKIARLARQRQSAKKAEEEEKKRGSTCPRRGSKEEEEEEDSDDSELVINLSEDDPLYLESLHLDLKEEEATKGGKEQQKRKESVGT